jgi:hypothetical protein
VHVVRHQVPFLYLAFLSAGELVEYGAQVPPDLPKRDVVLIL